MGDVLAEVVLPGKTGLLADACVNTFSFITAATPPSAGNMDAISGALANFYNTVPAGHNAIAGFINESILRTANGVTVKFYDLAAHLDGSPHGSPIGIRTFTLGAMVPGAVAAPREIAAALSFHADFGAAVEFAPGSRPRSSFRGRVYIGPLTQSVWQTEGTTGRVNFTQTFRETLVTQAAALRDAGIGWSVWSRRLGQLRDVLVVSVDDAIDVQRRRGEKALIRTSG